MAMKPMEWKGDHLALLDQRLLPHTETWLKLRSTDDVIDSIKQMAVRGAPAIGIAAAYGFVLALQRQEPINEAASKLRNSRPTAVNLMWAVDRMQALNTLDAALALEEARRIETEDLAMNLAIGENGAELIDEGSNILTLCNTGALATAGHGTALGIIRTAHEQNKNIHVWACETRPRQQGLRLTAYELKHEGIPFHSIADSAAASLMAAGKVDAVIVGADRIAANGDSANKIGTYMLAVLANYHLVPFYVAAPSSTFDTSIETGDEIPIEERHSSELTHFEETAVGPEGTPVYNPAFDVAPASLITAIVTEKGVFQAALPFRMNSFDIGRFIAARRDGKIHSAEELAVFSKLAGAGELPDYQITAWLMAAYLNPLTLGETAWLTQGMADSGERLDLSGLARPWLDKHSTGGVGDKTTLVVLPILAACGVSIVKMSGRGLGITGGTLDKLASVPGLNLDLTPAQLIAQAKEIGIALAGQTPSLAPADKVLYALRDATQTVASMPLIVSSILSKKIAGGSDSIVLDVKCGSGAFMTNLEHARMLKSMLIEVGTRCGLNVQAEITDMSQPLGSSVGNALEVREALKVLRNQRLTGPEERFRTLCLTLCDFALKSIGLSASAREALESGRAYEKLEQWFRAQGATFIDPPKGIGLVSTPITASSGGYLARLNAGLLGEVVLELGGGRKTKDDVIDLEVGLIIHKNVGEAVSAGDPVLTIIGTGERAVQVKKLAESAFDISEREVPVPELILG